MSATTIQPVQAASALGGASSPPVAGGAFEAVLAAIGSEEPTAPPGPVAAPAAALEAGRMRALEIDPLAEPSPDLLGSPDNPADAPAEPDAALALLTAPIVVPVNTGPQTASPTGAANAAPPAWGREKAAGLPAAPALAKASPNAAFHRTETNPDTDGPDLEAPDAPPAVAVPEPSRGARSATLPPPAATSAPPPVATAAAPEAAAGAPPDTAEPTSPPLSTATGVVPATPASTTAATALIAPPRVETPGRAAKSDRARGIESVEAAPTGEARRAAGPGAPRSVQAASASAPTGTESPRAEALPAASEFEDPTSAAPLDTAAAEAPTTAPSLHAAIPVRGAPETVANLAAQILKKLDGRSTRFDVELDPAGLGKVDVRIEIGPHGRMTAAMSFDNPQAAQDLKARSGELRQALEQAGFDLSGGLSFDVARDGGGGRGQAWQDAEQGSHAFRGQAFRAALDSAAGAADSAVQGALRLRQGVISGLDLRI